MKAINVQWKGISPLLQNKRPLPNTPIIKVGDRVIVEANKTTKRKNETDIIDILKLCHSDDKGIFIPYNAVFKTIMNGGQFVQGKTRMQTMKKVIMYGTTVNPERIYLKPQQEPEAFERALKRADGQLTTAVDAMFKDWSIDFEIQVDDRVVNIDKLRESIDLAGTLVGLGCWAPRDTGGRFGKFEVTKWEVK